jgi:hypothetical protein
MTNSRPGSSKSKVSLCFYKNSNLFIEPAIFDLNFKNEEIEVAHLWPRRIFHLEKDIEPFYNTQVKFEAGRFSRPISGFSNRNERIDRNDRDAYSISPTPWSDHDSQEKIQKLERNKKILFGLAERAPIRLKSAVANRSKSAPPKTVKESNIYNELENREEKTKEIYHLNRAQIGVPVRPQTCRPSIQTAILGTRARPKTCGEFRTLGTVQRPISAFKFNEKVNINTGMSVLYPRRGISHSARKSVPKTIDLDDKEVDLIDPIIADYRILQIKTKKTKVRFNEREGMVGGVLYINSKGWNIGQGGSRIGNSYILDI